MHRVLVVAVMLLSLCSFADAVANRAVYLNDSSGDGRVSSFLYLPSVWQQNFATTGYPSVSEYLPTTYTEGPLLTGIQFSAATTQSIWFTAFLPDQFVSPSIIDVSMGYSVTTASASAKKVLWHMRMWRVYNGYSMSSITGSNPMISSTWTVDTLTTAKKYTVDLGSETNGIYPIGENNWSGITPAPASDMYLIRLEREAGSALDTCTSALDVYWIKWKFKTTPYLKSLGF